MSDKKYIYEDFLEIIARLRAPDGCHRDREQTHESLKKCLLEDSEEGRFTMDDVLQGISEKMVRRHPHVFGDVKASSV